MLCLSKYYVKDKVVDKKTIKTNENMKQVISSEKKPIKFWIDNA